MEHSIAPTPDQRKVFQASREAIASAETNEQIVARLRRDCEAEKRIRSQAVLNETLDAGGSLQDAWDAVVAEMNRIDREYGALIGKYRKPSAGALSIIAGGGLGEARVTPGDVGDLRAWGRV